MVGHGVLHVAFSDDWEACERFGEYDVATRNTLYEVAGFVHATTLSALPSVLHGPYADASIPLVLAARDGRTVPAVIELERADGRWVVPDLSGFSVRP